MKITLFTPQLPFPPHQGTTIRNFNFIKNLARHHRIRLVSFGSPEELTNAPELSSLCEWIQTAPYPKRTMLKRLVDMVTSPFPDMGMRLKSDEMLKIACQVLGDESTDLVQVEGIEMAGYVLQSNRHRVQLPIVFDDHNAEYVLQQSAFSADSRHPTRWHAAAYSLVQFFKLKRYEREICSLAQAVIAASSADADSIRALGVSTPITIVPNGVDTFHFVPSDEVCARPLAKVTMVYAGKMDFRPNIDAMVWFCKDILPLIRAQIPSAQVVIVGQKPTRAIRSLGNQTSVQVKGWVPDTRPFIADAAVYVVPLRMGSGTRLKVLEAMAMGKSIVSTSRGVQGIDIVAGRHALIADSEKDFTDCVVQLLRDEHLRSELGMHARELVVTRYDWKTIVPTLNNLYASLVHR